MPIRIEAYTAEGILSGSVAWPGHLRDALEAAPQVTVAGAIFAPLDGRPPGPSADLSMLIDELVVATSDEPLPGLVHAAWHAIVIEAGPYRLEGELATLPGFDPGRALTQPSGTFVHLRDVRISLLQRPEAGTAAHAEGLVNRYLVDIVESDLMLGFFFPGARMEGAGALPPKPSAAARPSAAQLNADAPSALDAPPMSPLRASPRSMAAPSRRRVNGGAHRLTRLGSAAACGGDARPAAPAGGPAAAARPHDRARSPPRRSRGSPS